MNITKYISKRYIVAIAAFVVWMVFLDPTSYFIHKELNDSIDKLETQRAHFKAEIAKDKQEIKVLKTDSGLERFARERYYMKKDDETIFIIETDSLKGEK